MDYDFAAHAAGFMERMKGVSRRGVAHGVCFMVHRRVFDTSATLTVIQARGYEDDEISAGRGARVTAGMTAARSCIISVHHAKSIKAASQGKIKSLGDREYYRRKTGRLGPNASSIK